MVFPPATPAALLVCFRQTLADVIEGFEQAWRNRIGEHISSPIAE